MSREWYVKHDRKFRTTLRITILYPVRNGLGQSSKGVFMSSRQSAGESRNGRAEKA